MSGSVVGIIVLACTFGGALIGLFLRKALPGHHLDSDSRDTIKQRFSRDPILTVAVASKTLQEPKII
jgi:hypothetical protein